MNKKKALFLSMALIGANVCFADSLGLQKAASSSFSHDRLIEPTSPILGYALAKEIKANTNHPEIIFEELIKRENIRFDIAVSTHAYFQTLTPGLDKFCNDKNFKTLKRSDLTEVEHAAIPIEVLIPFHTNYKRNLNIALFNFDNLKSLKNSTSKVSNAFQDMRANCGTAKKLAAVEKKLSKFCIGPFDFCEDSKSLNHILSSAEVGYPRVQYSLNGYTRFVYSELLKSPNLKGDLRRIYDLEVEWLDKYEKDGDSKTTFFGFVSDEALKLGMHPNDIFLILGFSMRNMPSLDIEYSQNADKALLLETYFWSFKKIKGALNKVKQKNLTFPNYSKGGLGIYHYLTASLLSCQARLSGMGEWLSEFLGMFSKLAYKVNKLYKSIEKKKWSEGGISYVRKLAKKQGFGVGVDAGIYGGKFGSKVCGGYYSVKEELFEEAVDNIRSDYTRDVRRGYKKRRRVGSKIKRKVKLSSKQMVAHNNYLERIQLEIENFKIQTRSVLDD
jgi:hypothetical protein